MKKIFICSPYRGKNAEERQRNINYAKALAREIALVGCVPYVPHLYLTQILNDESGRERETGIKAGLAFMEACDEVVVGAYYGITEGMRSEINYAKLLDKKITYFDFKPENLVTFSTKEHKSAVEGNGEAVTIVTIIKTNVTENVTSKKPKNI